MILSVILAWTGLNKSLTEHNTLSLTRYVQIIRPLITRQDPKSDSFHQKMKNVTK